MHRMIAVLGLSALAACDGSGPDDKDILARAERLAQPLPGLYRSTTKLTGFELSGADPQLSDQMRDRFGLVSPAESEYCLTPEDAARGFEGVVRQTQQGDCAIERFDAGGTRLSAQMTCNGGNKLTSRISVEGTGEPDRSHIVLEIVQSGPAIAGGSATISMEIDSRRIGDCPRTDGAG